MKAYIGGFLQNQKHRWEKLTSLIIFFSGSNFACSFFNNPEFNTQKKEHLIDISLIEKQIRKYASLTDSIIIDGGEPTLQKEALIMLLKLAKKEELKTCISTNGTKPEVIKTLIKQNLLDKVELVLPAPLNDKWFRLVKFSGYFLPEEEAKKAIINSLIMLSKSNITVEVNTTLVPGIIFRKEQFLSLTKIIPENTTWIIKIKTLKKNGIVKPSEDYVKDLIKELKNFKNLNIKTIIL